MKEQHEPRFPHSAWTVIPKTLAAYPKSGIVKEHKRTSGPERVSALLSGKLADSKPLGVALAPPSFLRRLVDHAYAATLFVGFESQATCSKH